MTINFMGLIGPLGAMPNYVTELIAGASARKDHTMLEFLNIFNHRLTSFFYQAWEKNHFTVAYERDHSDPLTACLYAMIGFGTPGIRDRQPVEDEAFIFYSGLFGSFPNPRWRWNRCWAIISTFRWNWSRSSAPGARWPDPTSASSAATFPESTMLGFGAVVGRRGLGSGIARAAQARAVDAGAVQRFPAHRQSLARVAGDCSQLLRERSGI